MEHSYRVPHGQQHHQAGGGEHGPQKMRSGQRSLRNLNAQTIYESDRMNVTVFEDGRRQAIAARLRRMTEPSGECLLWTGPAYPSGYGRFRFVEMGRKRQTSPHRAAYILAHGSVSEELVIDHLCRNRLCVKVEHLEAVSHAENVRRGMWPLANRPRLGVPVVGKECCPRGHLLTEENTYLHHRAKFSPGRECRTCKREMRTPSKPEHREAQKRLNGASRLQASSHRQPWSDAETAFVLQSSLPDVEIAAATGRTISAIRNRRQRLSQRLVPANGNEHNQTSKGSTRNTA